MTKARFLIVSILLLMPSACVDKPSALLAKPMPTPEPVDGFGYPLDPGRYGSYVRGVTGPLNVDTRFGVQNPGLGDVPKCFQDIDGEGVPFRELYHAGEDWFRLDLARQGDFSAARGDPVRAVARGVVYMTQSIGDQGWIVVLAHRLADGSPVYSAYWHVNDVQVERDESVERGQVFAVVHDQKWNSHLHWELRNFADGSDHFSDDSAGGRGTCNGHIAGVGYTWDDDPTRARPEYWGYFDPVQFIENHRP